MSCFSKCNAAFSIGLMAGCLFVSPVVAQTQPVRVSKQAQESQVSQDETARIEALSPIARQKKVFNKTMRDAAVAQTSMGGDTIDDADNTLTREPSLLKKLFGQSNVNEVPAEVHNSLEMRKDAGDIAAPKVQDAVKALAVKSKAPKVDIVEARGVVAKDVPRQGIVFDDLPEEVSEVVKDNATEQERPREQKLVQVKETIEWNNDQKGMRAYPPPEVISKSLGESIDWEKDDSRDDSGQKNVKKAVEQSFSWQALKGSNIRQTLELWAKEQDVGFVWDSQNEFAVLKPFSMSGTFSEAVAGLLEQYKNNDLRLTAKIKVDQSTLKRSLYVTDQKST